MREMYSFFCTGTVDSVSRMDKPGVTAVLVSLSWCVDTNFNLGGLVTIACIVHENFALIIS